MKEPRRLTRSVALAIHADQIRAHGGTPGFRDPGLLESALERPLSVTSGDLDEEGLTSWLDANSVPR